MAKIPVGVGPKLPQIVVLFGATGDLSQRKLLPGLFHLVTAGFIPKCRIVGVALDPIDVEFFRDGARKAIHAHFERKAGGDKWPAFAASLDYAPWKAGAAALRAAVED